MVIRSSHRVKSKFKFYISCNAVVVEPYTVIIIRLLDEFKRKRSGVRFPLTKILSLVPDLTLWEFHIMNFSLTLCLYCKKAQAKLQLSCDRIIKAYLIKLLN